MVAADAAGVAFTLDPVSGARDVAVVEAVTGLGDQLPGAHLPIARPGTSRVSSSKTTSPLGSGAIFVVSMPVSPVATPLGGRQVDRCYASREAERSLPSNN